MPDLKLIKNPGYVYDLMFVFYFKYNKDILPELFDLDEDEMEFFSEQMKLFEPISDDLYIFFRIISSKRCFFTANYFDSHASTFTTEYDLALVQREINDRDAFVKNVIKHYFDCLNDDQVNECMTSNKRMFDVIKKSDYDEKVKAKFYEFFIDPESYIRQLQYEIIAMDVQLSSYYERNYSKILDVYNELNSDLIEKECEFFGHNMADKMNRSNVCISFCLLNKRLVRFSYQQDATIYLMGVDFRASLERLRNKYIDVSPERFGAALADPSRVKMLEVMRQRGECTCKELEEALGIPASTTYHHITALEKSRAVEARIRKKTMIYKINRKYFSDMIEYLKKFLESAEDQ